MKHFTVVLVFVLLAGCAGTKKVATISNYEAKGNLEATNYISCVDISSLSSLHTPADIYIGIADCIVKDDAKKASKLFSLAGAYGWYDRLRVTDRTAHQALRVLQMNYLYSASEDFKTKFQSEMKVITEDGTPEFEQLCSTIKSVGKPTYYPRYMIQHGMGAFTGDSKGLTVDFSEEEGWKNALENYLHCTV
jgi:hypothetical protein